MDTIKDVVQQKYGEAALPGAAAASSRVVDAATRLLRPIRSRRTSTTRRRPRRFPLKRCSRRSAAATRPRSRS